ncbi:hypothetical protein ACOJBM_31975 [Rhizobium beringeri]
MPAVDDVMGIRPCPKQRRGDVARLLQAIDEAAQIRIPAIHRKVVAARIQPIQMCHGQLRLHH